MAEKPPPAEKPVEPPTPLPQQPDQSLIRILEKSDTEPRDTQDG